MAETSAIEWTDSTWNVVTGCTRVSRGCERCYIERTTPFRTQGRRFLPLVEGGDPTAIGTTTGVELHPKRLTWPYRTGKRALGPRVFVNSLSDLWHDEVPDRFIAQVYAVMADTPHLTYQMLTKRPARMRTMTNAPAFGARVAEALTDLGIAREATWLNDDGYGHEQLRWTTPDGEPKRRLWPLPNAWHGVSVEDMAAAYARIPQLIEADVAVRWLSCEPLLERVELAGWMVDEHIPWHYTDYGVQCSCGASITRADDVCNGRRIDWCVIGGESGPDARPMHPGWVRRILRDCEEGGTPAFVKQLGAWALTSDADADEVVDGTRMRYLGVRSKQGDMSKWPAALQVRRFPDEATAVLT